MSKEVEIRCLNCNRSDYCDAEQAKTKVCCPSCGSFRSETNIIRGNRI